MICRKMKTKRFCGSYFLMLLSIGIITGQQPVFQKTYGGAANETGNSIYQTTDGGYIITGSTESYGFKNGFTDVYLIKTNSAGDTLWTKTFGGALYDDGYAVRQTSDLGYIVVGNTSSFGNGGFDIYMIRTDVNGKILWSKTIGGTSNDYGFDVKQTSDGGFIVAGRTLNFGAINHDVYVVKTDGSGNFVWGKSYGREGDDYGYSVQQTKDGGYIIGGNRGTVGFYLIKTGETGDSTWTKNFYIGSTSHINTIYSVQQTTDNGYIVAGLDYAMDIFLAKTSSSGIIQWAKTYKGSSHDYALSVHQTSDGGYIIGGWTMSFPVGSYHSLLMKTNSTGELSWAKTYHGGGSSPVGYSVQQASDGGYIFLGSTTAAGAGLWDMYIVKTDENGNSNDCNQATVNPTVEPVTITVSKPVTNIGSGGVASSPDTKTGWGSTVKTLCSGVGISEESEDISLKVFPNPFTNTLLIKGTLGNGEINIYDISGKIKLRRYATDGETKISTNSLVPGLYFLNYIENDKSTIIKLIKY